MQSKVLLIYTGGTIGMNRNPQTGALEPLHNYGPTCRMSLLTTTTSTTASSYCTELIRWPTRHLPSPICWRI